MVTDAPATPAKSRPLAVAAYATFVIGAVAAGAAAALAFVRPGDEAALVPGLTIYQANRHFSPEALHVRVGDTVTIVNDDGTTVHHAYVPEEGIDFDSGDQEPGSRANVTFGRAGDYRVLCGIHPRMQSVVRVR